MPFKKGISGKPVGSISSSTKLLREQISLAINGNKLSEMLNQITNPTEYINAVSKLLPYAIGKKKAYEKKHPRVYGSYHTVSSRELLRRIESGQIIFLKLSG